MRKGRKKSSTSKAGTLLVEPTVFRLCHHCLHLNESDGEILRCQKCQKYVTVEPFLHFLEHALDDDDEEMDIPPDEDFVAPGSTTDKPVLITGLAVRW